MRVWEPHHELVAACQIAGVDPADAKLLRVSAAAAFSLANQGLFARVSRPGELGRAADEIAFASTLADSGLVLSPAMPDIFTGVSSQVTFWPLAQPVDAATFDQSHLGAAVAALHRQPTDGLPAAPALLDTVEVRLRFYAGRPHAEKAIIRSFGAALDRLARSEPHTSGPQVAVHGDVLPANIVAVEGRAYFTDFDLSGVGPAHIDLSGPPAQVARYGADTCDIESFFAGYGRDPRDEPHSSWWQAAHELVFASAGLMREDDSAKDQLRLRARSLHSRSEQWTSAPVPPGFPGSRFQLPAATGGAPSH